MAKSKARDSARHPQTQESESEPAAPTLRERVELILFLVVEVLCILLFVDFLFIGYYVK
ncbi:MAG: hypothetical protein QGI83_23905 [Candidatus Latescibacteria bacterium]|jgi:hypothetical protein|nr:hypothetical protein [Candidatus Latescibacterota bacterium]